MYPDNQFSIDLAQADGQTMHFHSEMELLYVLDGQVKVRIQDQSWEMGKDDILAINSGVSHCVEGIGHHILCIVKYDYKILTEVVSQSGPLFVCNSCADQTKDYGDLRYILKELIYGEVLYKKKTPSYKYSLFYHLLDLLSEQYMIENLHVNTEEYDASEKLQKVMHYIYQNYQDGISLSELAEQMYISTSTLSRFFKKQTGIYFAEYVSQIRMKYAVNEMLYSNKNITKIAMDCGFSNVSSFNKVFRENFELAPTEYRTKMKEQEKEKEKEKEQIRKELRMELQEQVYSKKDEEDSESRIILDLDRTVTYQKSWNKCINIGNFSNLTKANVQFHLLYLTGQLGFTHARVWSIFSDKLMVTDGKTIGSYNYDNMDSVLDFLVQNHIKPWIDFYQRPDTAVRSAGNNVWYEENSINFVSRRVWEAFFTDFVKHLVRRYGKEELQDWIFEIGSDPFNDRKKYYYEDPNYSFWNVYEFVYHLLRKLAPGAEIGGPDGISNGDVEVAKTFMRNCREKNCIPDFLSFGLFPYIPREHIKEDEVPYVRCPDMEYELGQIQMLRQNMIEAGLSECKLYISEWNNSVSNRNYMNDSCFRGLYICKKLSEIWDSVDCIGLWTGSDWVSNYYDSYSVANGGSGILTKDGIRKPAFYAMMFLNQLSGLLVAKGENYIVTKSQNGNIDILCFNCNWYSVNYYLMREDEISLEQLDSVLTECQELTLQLELNHVVEDCEYMVKRSSVNREHGSILDKWSSFGYERNLERQDVKYLQEICVPELRMQHVKSTKGKLILTIPLKEQEFVYYHISRLEE